MDLDIRWKQRFNNFEKVTKQLQELLYYKFKGLL